jgi:hypothetical protein
VLFRSNVHVEFSVNGSTVSSPSVSVWKKADICILTDEAIEEWQFEPRRVVGAAHFKQLFLMLRAADHKGLCPKNLQAVKVAVFEGPVMKLLIQVLVGRCHLEVVPKKRDHALRRARRRASFSTSKYRTVDHRDQRRGEGNVPCGGQENRIHLGLIRSKCDA